MKIWQRYFLGELLKVFTLLICSFYALYILIDYSSRTGTFQALGLSSTLLFLYYLNTFILRMDILVPFALMLATIKTLINANTHRELVALLASGIKLKEILRPFLYVGLAFTALIFCNTEFILPRAKASLQSIEELRFLSAKDNSNRRAHSIVLKDHTTLIYQNYDATQQQFFDVYWIRTINDFYRMKYLNLKQVPEGDLVDHFTRDSKGLLQQESAVISQTFPQIQFADENITEILRPASDQSLTQIWKQLPHNKPDKQARLLTALYQKALMPWLCLLAVLAPIPFCVRFTRNLPVFFIYLLSMFGLVTVYLVMNAMTTISKNQVIDPMWALLLPMAAVASVCSWRYVKLQ